MGQKSTASLKRGAEPKAGLPKNALHPLEEMDTGCQWQTRDRAISKRKPVDLSLMGTAQRLLPGDERTAGQPSLQSLPPAGHQMQLGGDGAALTSSDQNSVFCEHQEIHMWYRCQLF
ncbi:hypothetical protein A6R68_15053, partial [Neotoma lepida]